MFAEQKSARKSYATALAQAGAYVTPDRGKPRLTVAVLAVDHALSPPASLRVVHRGVGGGDHRIGGPQALRADSDADAGQRDPPISPDLVRCSERLGESVRNGQCRPRGDVIEEEDELISTHASGGVSRPQHRSHPIECWSSPM